MFPNCKSWYCNTFFKKNLDFLAKSLLKDCYLTKISPQQESIPWVHQSLEVFSLVFKSLKRLSLILKIKWREFLGANKNPPQISGKANRINPHLQVCLELIILKQLACSFLISFKKIKFNQNLLSLKLNNHKNFFFRRLNPKKLFSRIQFNLLICQHSNKNNHRLSKPFPKLKIS